MTKQESTLTWRLLEHHVLFADPDVEKSGSSRGSASLISNANTIKKTVDMIGILFVNAFTFTAVLSQGCGTDLLVDDFSTTQRNFFDNADRVINRLGGDYGTDGETTFNIDTTARTLTVIPKENENVFFYAKYDQGACFDLTPFYGFQFDLIAPAGASGSFTLTQKTADCSERVDGGDSVYLPLSKYYTTPGKKQTVVIPFADFAKLASGKGEFDFEHLKDWTFVNPKPLGEAFVFSNMVLLGGAPGCNNTSSTTSVGVTNTVTNTATAGTVGTSVTVETNTSGSSSGTSGNGSNGSTGNNDSAKDNNVRNLPVGNSGFRYSFSLGLAIMVISLIFA